jgi:hypothetical protein
MILTGFFRCPCGKVHTRGGVSYNSLCTCGRNLYNLAFNIIEPAERKRVDIRAVARECAVMLAKRQGR